MKESYTNLSYLGVFANKSYMDQHLYDSSFCDTTLSHGPQWITSKPYSSLADQLILDFYLSSLKRHFKILQIQLLLLLLLLLVDHLKT